jgi:ubiquinone/menaquinone biosynthesis C-methylase UbiE
MPALDHLAGVAKAASDPLRLTILRLLARESLGVLELCHVLDVPQPALSHHLKVLFNAGLVATRREGNSVFYRRALAFDPLSEALHHELDEIALEAELSARLADIHAERAEKSRAFFSRHAERFHEFQNLIALPDAYLGALTEMLDRASAEPDARALDVGSGTGELLPMLSERFKRVTAIDNAPAMLDQAREATKRAGLDNIRFVQGELEDLPESNQYDLIVASMVIHHTRSPARFCESAVRRLRSGGRLLIAELIAHDQDWVREACGDVWLGFDPDELMAWCESAGLNVDYSQFLAQKNGFCIQLLQTSKETTS